MNVDLIKKRMNEVIHRTALENENYDFMATHVPFKGLSYEKPGHMGAQTLILSEQDFFRENILKEKDKHKLVVIRGNAGSGKSHFIRWLYHNYVKEVDKEEDLAILISRDDNTLKAALKQIVASDIFSKIEDGDKYKKLIDASNALDEKEIKEQILAFLIAIINTDEEKGPLKKRVKRNLHSFLSDEVIREELLLVNNGPIERIVSKLISSEVEIDTELEPKFYSRDFNIQFGTKLITAMTRGETASSNRARELAEMIADEGEQEDSGLKADISGYLNKHLDKAIQNIIKIGQSDLIEIFKEIRTSLKNNGTDLTLFIEDITTFAGISKELVETLLIDHNTDKNLCRIMSFIGITEGYYQSDLPDNIKGRIADNIIIDDKSLFKSLEDVIELIARYLNAIYNRKEEVESWYLNGAYDDELPITSINMDKEWSIFELPNGKKVSLFPFNERALQNIFLGLIEKEDKTPRNFLGVIFFNLFPYYLNNMNKFPPQEEDFGNIKLPRWEDDLLEDMIKSDDEIKAKRISTLIRLWGDATLRETYSSTGEKIIGGISEDMFKDFGLPIIEGVGVPKGEKEQHADDEEKKDDKEKTIEKEESPEISATDKKEYEKYREELEKWKKGGILSSHKFLREETARIFNKFIYWEKEGVSPLIQKQILTISNIHIEGQNVKIGKGLVLDRSDATYYFLLGIVSWRYLGNKSWNFQNSSEYLLRITNYVLKHKEGLIKIIHFPQGIVEEEWEYEKWALINSYYLNIINGNFTKINMSREEIYFQLFRNKIQGTEKDYGKKWNNLIQLTERDQKLEQNHNRLIRYYNLILGDANPETVGNYTIDTFRVLKNIDILTKMKWDVKLLLPKNKYEGDTIQFVPIGLIYRHWKDKIDNLIINQITEIKGLINDINKKIGKDLTLDVIKEIRINAKRFLEETMASVGLHYDTKSFEYLTENEDKSKEIYESYIECLNLLEEEPINQLLIMSKLVEDEIFSFNKELIFLNELIKKTDKFVSDRIKEFGEDLAQEFSTRKNKLELKVDEIKSNINDLLGVN